MIVLISKPFLLRFKLLYKIPQLSKPSSYLPIFLKSFLLFYSHITRDRETKILLHGYMSSGHEKWILDMKDAILKVVSKFYYSDKIQIMSRL